MGEVEARYYYYYYYYYYYCEFFPSVAVFAFKLSGVKNTAQVTSPAEASVLFLDLTLESSEISEKLTKLQIQA